MFERSTERARRILAIAQEEAKNLNHDYLGTEHILLGLIREGEGVAAEVLRNMGIKFKTIRLEIENEAPPGGALAILGNVPFTPNSKKVLELAVEEARNMGHNYIGTEHLLLGLIKKEESIGAKILAKFGVTLEKAKEEIAKILGSFSSPVVIKKNTLVFTFSCKGVDFRINFNTPDMPANIKKVFPAELYRNLKKQGLHGLSKEFRKILGHVSKKEKKAQEIDSLLGE